MQATAHTTPTSVSINRHQYGWSVEASWDGVDRPCTGGIVLGDLRLAERLAAAMREGAWFTSAEVATDVNGKTYVQATGYSIGKYAASALRELGY